MTRMGSFAIDASGRVFCHTPKRELGERRSKQREVAATIGDVHFLLATPTRFLFHRSVRDTQRRENASTTRRITQVHSTPARLRNVNGSFICRGGPLQSDIQRYVSVGFFSLSKPIPKNMPVLVEHLL